MHFFGLFLNDNICREWTYVDIFLNNLYWRNTKESVKNEYELPPVVEDLVLLDYTPIEAVLYKDFSVYASNGTPPPPPFNFVNCEIRA